MNQELPKHLREYVDNKIKSGEFSSQDDAIEQAIAAHKVLDSMAEDFKRDVQIGIDQLERGEFSRRSLRDIAAEVENDLSEQ